MEFKNEDIGIKILEIITSGLYDGNKNCLREYVQNCIDSHANRIDIYFEDNNLIIKDNGSGMDESDLKTALGIGLSKKEEEDVGWRGVGIWSGVPICNRIVIITRKSNGKKIRVEIDNDKLRNDIDKDMPILNALSEVTDKIVTLDLGKNEDSHFTEIRLESILPTQRPIFNEKDIIEYLQKTVPVPFDEEQFPLAKKINKVLSENCVSYRTAKIIFNKKEDKPIKPIYRPPHKSDIFFGEPIYKKFIVNGVDVAFGWFLTTNQNKKLPESNIGIFFKKKGFTIGDKNTVTIQWGKSYNEWQYGEIHIISKSIKENAGRNYFEYNNDLIAPFLKSVGEFIGKLARWNHYQSKQILSNHITKIENALTQEDSKSANNELNKIKKKTSRKTKCPEEEEFKEIKKLIDKKSTEENQKINKFKQEIKKMKTDILTSKEYLDSVVNSLPDAFEKYKKKITREGRLYPAIDIMQEISEILKKKTNSQKNDIQELTKIAYGWGEIQPSPYRALLTLTNGEKFPRDMRFGLMIYTMYDLFVNTFKHERGLKRFEWFEGCTDDKKCEILSGMYGTIGMLYRLIENSKIRQP